MASIQQVFELVDGVSPVLNRMQAAVARTVGAFSNAVRAATHLEDAARASGAGVAEGADQAVTAVTRISSATEKASDSFSKLKNMISGYTLGNLIANGIEKMVSKLAEIPGRLMAAADEYANIQARLRLVAGGAEKAAELNDAIFASAMRARGSYDTMADSVSKIAMTAKEAFPDARQVVPFVEGIQKLFAIGGTDAQQASAAMLQLTQALGSGRLQGDEFRSIAEAAPLIEQMVARTMGVTQGELKALSSQGVITADIIKRAIFENMDDINAMFADMPMTFAQAMTMIQNVAQREFAGVYDRLSNMVNGDLFNRLTAGAIVAIRGVAKLIDGIANNAMWLANVIRKNGAVVEGVLAALAAGTAVYAGLTLASTVQSGAFAAALWLQQAATMAVTIAQGGLNVALMANPIGVVVGAVMLLVAAFYAGVAAINHFTGANISATGIIFGAFAWLGTSIMNILKAIANRFIAVANFLGAVFVDPLAATWNLFADIWNGIVGLVGDAVNSILSMVSKLPGMGGFAKQIELPTLKRENIGGAAWHIDAYEYGNAGYNAEQAYKVGAEGLNLPGLKDLIPKMGDEIGDEIARSGMPDDTGETAGNTGAIKDAMEIMDEDLKYLRENAEQEAINKYTTAEVKIDMGGVQNNIASDIDVDGMMVHLTDSLFDAMASGREAVTA